MSYLSRLCILVSFLGTPFMAGAATSAVNTSEAGSVYLAGSDIRLTAPVAADLFAAGGRVGIDREVGADAAVAGGAIDVRAPVMQDLRVAGGSVVVGGDVGGELIAAGGTVAIDPAADVTGSALLAGRDVTLAGKIGKSVKIYGRNITISGQVAGDARLYGEQITLLPGARIAGNLSYASPNPLVRDNAAQVLGTITRESMPEGWRKEQAGTHALSWFHPFFVLSMLAAGMLLYLIFPAAVGGTGRAIREFPLRSLITGLALLFAVPPVAILFMVTVIGLPIGLALLALYPLSLLLGYLATAFFVGARFAAAMKQPEPLSAGRQALFLVLSLIVLTTATAIPFAGGLVLIAIVTFGLGAWAVWIYGRRRAS